jgi:hypothetical protein
VDVSGSVSGSIILTASIDPDAVAGDDTWRRPIEARPSLRIGLIAPRRAAPRTGPSQYEPADWFRLALQPVDPGTSEPEMEVVDIEPEAVDGARLASLDAAIIPRPDALPEARGGGSARSPMPAAWSWSRPRRRLRSTSGPTP